MAFHDRRPNVDPEEQGVTPGEPTDEVETPAEEEGTPTDPEEKTDPDDVPEAEPEDVVAGPEEAEEEVATVVEEPKKAKTTDEPLESLQQKKADLLKEVEGLRAERRGLKSGPFQDVPKKDQPVFVKPEDDPLKDVAAQDVEVIEKVLRAKGYVKKDELSAAEYQREVHSFTDVWLEQNPDFKPENDPDDENWNKIKAYATKVFNKPVNPKDVLEILDITRDRLFGKKATNPLPTKSLHSVAAKKEKIAVSAKPSSGGSAGSKTTQPSSEKRAINPALLSYMHGFSEEELKEIASS